MAQVTCRLQLWWAFSTCCCLARGDGAGRQAFEEEKLCPSSVSPVLRVLSPLKRLPAETGAYVLQPTINKHSRPAEDCAAAMQECTARYSVKSERQTLVVR